MLGELEIVLKGMKHLKSIDDQSIVIEMIEYANESFKVRLTTLLNQSLVDGLFDESLYLSIRQMLPKDRDLNQLSNWRPIVVLPIFYNKYYLNLFILVFRFIYSRNNLSTSMVSPLIYRSRMHFFARKSSSNTICKLIWNSGSSIWI